MTKRPMPLCLFLLPVFTTKISIALEERPKRTTTETLIAEMGLAAMVPDSFKVSPDGRRVLFGPDRGPKVCLSVNETQGKEYDGLGTAIFSPYLRENSSSASESTSATKSPPPRMR